MVVEGEEGACFRNLDESNSFLGTMVLRWSYDGATKGGI